MPTPQQEQHDSGSFVSGLGIGLLAGAAAYFLFGTEQGKELRKRALDEWDGVKDELADTGVVVPKQIKLILREVVGHFAAAISEIQELKEAKPVGKGKSKPSSKFKGL